MPKPPEGSSGKSPSEMSEAELEPFRSLSGAYPLLATMMRHDVPLNRDHYIDMAWPELAEEWSWEHEADLPPPFRKNAEDDPETE